MLAPSMVGMSNLTSLQLGGACARVAPAVAVVLMCSLRERPCGRQQPGVGGGGGADTSVDEHDQHAEPGRVLCVIVVAWRRVVLACVYGRVNGGVLAGMRVLCRVVWVLTVLV